MPREAPRETDSGPKASPLALDAAKGVALGPFRGTWQVRLPRGAPREKDSGGAPSPLGCSATSAVPLGRSRGTCGERAPRGGARETESGPKTSPLPRVAAKTVALGRFHATCRGRCATDSAEGDKSGRRAVSLGVLRGAIAAHARSASRHHLERPHSIKQLHRRLRRPARSPLPQARISDSTSSSTSRAAPASWPSSVSRCRRAQDAC